MCGFTGFWQMGGVEASETLETTIQNMTALIDHRGPDASGIWCNPSEGLAFGHRRLSVVDLSPLGHQPMASESGRLMMIYNGELYNTQELRKELEALGVAFKSTSDTEVVLEACEMWGVDKAVPRFIGMFSFVLWDRERRVLTLVRDRLGIKPLYWGFQGDTLFFGSQLKSFRPHSDWQGEIDRQALSSYFRYNYIPAPDSIFVGISKLRPGTYVTVNQDKTISETVYWDPYAVACNGTENRFQGFEEEAVQQLENLLKDAVGRRMVADVPLGAFLSGGVDSSTVVALMQAQSVDPVKTFSIGFQEEGFNEATYAKKVAAHLGTDHHELYLSSKEAQSIIPFLPDWYDEPFADSSQIPTYLVSRLAREHVTISLSGDGGDELFAGYQRYLLAQNFWSRVSRVPAGVRKGVSKLFRAMPPKAFDRLEAADIFGVLPAPLADKVYKGAAVLGVETLEDVYHHLISFWESPELLVKTEQGGLSLPSEGAHMFPWDQKRMAALGTATERMQLMDMVTYLPDDILAKVDRASMAVGLEARVPLLDHRVVEFAWTLPLSYKIRGRESKWILKQVLEKYVPRQLTDRPKMGFGVPIGAWLRGPLRAWAEDLLSQERLEAEGLLNPALIRQRWEDHIKGRYNWQYSLWGVLMFQAWYQAQKVPVKLSIKPEKAKVLQFPQVRTV